LESLKKRDSNGARRNMAKHMDNALRKTLLININDK